MEKHTENNANYCTWKPGQGGPHRPLRQIPHIPSHSTGSRRDPCRSPTPCPPKAAHPGPSSCSSRRPSPRCCRQRSSCQTSSSQATCHSQATGWVNRPPGKRMSKCVFSRYANTAFNRTPLLCLLESFQHCRRKRAGRCPCPNSPACPPYPKARCCHDCPPTSGFRPRDRQLHTGSSLNHLRARAAQEARRPSRDP